MTYKLLIVDDELPNVRLLERLFREDYFCLTASSGKEALNLIEQHDVAVLITDQRMPHMTGIELLKRSADSRPHMVRILLTGYTDIEALVEAINCGLVYTYVSKPWNNEDLKLRVSRAVQHYEDNKRRHSLVAANERLESRLLEMKLGLVRTIAAALKLKDEYAYTHGSRVSKCAAIVGETLGLRDDLLTDLTAAALLHDLGAIGTPDQVLLKSDALTTNELSILQRHPARGAQVLSCIPELRDAADIIRYNRENYDGSGFPLGLVAEQIPLTSRIVRVASEYDLLIQPRDASLALSHKAAIEELSKGARKEFDPQVLRVVSDLGPSELGDLSAVDELDVGPARAELVTSAASWPSRADV
jgi:response regulator RpfG family c-di-GMP phosphodiesterase